MIVCYIGCVVAVEPLYVLGFKAVGDQDEELSGVLVLSKYDFAKNTWKDYIFSSQEIILEVGFYTPIYVYDSRVYCLIKNSLQDYTLYIFDHDLTLLIKKTIEVQVVPKSGLYVDNQGIFVGGVFRDEVGSLKDVKLFKYDLLGNFDKSLSLVDFRDNSIFYPVSFQKDQGLLYVSGYLENDESATFFGGLKYLGVDPRSLQEKKSRQQKDLIQIDDTVFELSICFIKGSFGYMLTASNQLAIVRLQDMVTINTVEIPVEQTIYQVQVDGNKLLILSAEEGFDGKSILYEYSLSGKLLFSQELNSNDQEIYESYTCFNIQKGKAYFVGVGFGYNSVYRLINQLSDNLRQSTLIGKENIETSIYFPITCASEEGRNLQNLQRFSPLSFQRGSGFRF